MRKMLIGLVLILVLFASGSFADNYFNFEYKAQFGAQEIGRASGIAIDASDNIYVGDPANGVVHKFNNDLKHVAKIRANKLNYNGSNDVVVDKAGNIYVMDSYNKANTQRIVKFDKNGSFVNTFGKKGVGEGEFNNMTGIAINYAGSIFVLDNPYIKIFTSNGKFITQWGPKYEISGKCITIDSLGIVYIAGPFYINKYDPLTGELIEAWEQFFLKSPEGIVVDKGGRVYVTDQFDKKVKIFDNKGKLIDYFHGSKMKDGNFNNVFGIAIDSMGCVYVAEDINHRVQKFALAIKAQVIPAPDKPIVEVKSKRSK